MKIVDIKQPLGNWVGARMTPAECRRALALAHLVKNTISERKSEWIKLVVYVHRGEVLPSAVAASMESLERRAKAGLKR